MKLSTTKQDANMTSEVFYLESIVKYLNRANNVYNAHKDFTANECAEYKVSQLECVLGDIESLKKVIENSIKLNKKLADK